MLERQFPQQETIDLRFVTDHETNKLVHAQMARNDTGIHIARGVVFKALKPTERTAYQVLNSYRGELRELGFIFPRIAKAHRESLPNSVDQVSTNDKTSLHLIERLSHIEPIDLDAFFGLGIDYEEEDFDFLFSTFDSLRSLVVEEDLALFPRYSDQIGYMHPRLPRKLPNSNLEPASAYQSVCSAYEHLRHMDEEAAHRDFNFSNFVITNPDNGDREIYIIDFETFGPALPGYDEGRLLIHMSLNPHAQDIYTHAYEQYCKSNLDDPNLRLLSFWTAANIRGCVELNYLQNGFYDQRLEFNYGEEKQHKASTICHNIEEIVLLSIDKIEELT